MCMSVVCVSEVTPFQVKLIFFVVKETEKVFSKSLFVSGSAGLVITVLQYQVSLWSCEKYVETLSGRLLESLVVWLFLSIIIIIIIIIVLSLTGAIMLFASKSPRTLITCLIYRNRKTGELATETLQGTTKNQRNSIGSTSAWCNRPQT